METKKVFIMTVPRSGSTLIGQQLGIHSNILHMGESMYWELFAKQNLQCSCGKKNCAFISTLYEEINNKHLAEPLLRVWQMVDGKYWPNKKSSESSVIQSSDTKTSRLLMPYWLNKCPDALNSIISVYKGHTDKETFVDNTKLFNIGLKLSKSPAWHILVLLRDPRGIMSSYKNAGERKGDFRTAESVIPFCLDFMSAVRKIVARKNVNIIRYEDFCFSPKETLIKICNFINEEYEDSMAIPFGEKVEYRGHILKGNRMLQSGGALNFKIDEQWKKNLTRQELQNLSEEKKLTNEYRNYGYKIG